MSTASPVIKATLQSAPFVPMDEPTVTRPHHLDPESLVYTTVTLGVGRFLQRHVAIPVVSD